MTEIVDIAGERYECSATVKLFELKGRRKGELAEKSGGRGRDRC